jgi:DNA-binding CsgD family transcriptional regulator
LRSRTLPGRRSRSRGCRVCRAGRSDATNPLELLTHRERQILQLIAEGKSSAQAATSLFLSPKTVDTYRSRLMQKLGHDLSSPSSLLRFAQLVAVDLGFLNRHLSHRTTDRAADLPNAMIHLLHCPAPGIVSERPSARPAETAPMSEVPSPGDQMDFRYSTRSTRWASVNPRLSSFGSL